MWVDAVSIEQIDTLRQLAARIRSRCALSRQRSIIAKRVRRVNAEYAAPKSASFLQFGMNSVYQWRGNLIQHQGFDDLRRENVFGDCAARRPQVSRRGVRWRRPRATSWPESGRNSRKIEILGKTC